MSDFHREPESSRWQLDESAFRALLRALDPQPARAAGEYERLRQRLTRYFALHGVPRSLDAADEAFNRLAKRLSEGEPVLNIEAYLAGIARLVMLEEHQKLNRERQMLLRLVTPESHTEEDDRLLVTLEACLAELPEASRSLLTHYYVGRGLERMRARERIARELGLSANSLRNRVLRLRQRLEKAVRARFGEEARDVSDRPHTSSEEDQ